MSQEEDDVRETPNSNCLAGMRCPKCGSYGPFGISVSAWAVVSDEGVDEASDFDWDDSSACLCKACGYTGTVAYFNETNHEGTTE